MDTAGGERPRAFQELLKDLARQQRDRVCLVSPTGEQLAVYCAFADGEVLRVPALRVAPHALGDTLARQILFLLRQTARSHGARAIRISDAHIGRIVTLAALDDGFQPDGPDSVAFTVDVTGNADEVNLAAALSARAAGLAEPALLRSTMTATAAAEIERMWWPAKLVDSNLPTYVVAIRQAYSRDLLGVPPTLDPRPALGLSRDHVYYRSVKGTRIEAPARVLWYMSAGGTSVFQQTAIVACSQLESVLSGPPKELHQRFRHLGVWSEQQVENAANDGVAQALRFTNTEAFPNPIGGEELRQIGQRHGGWHPPIAPRRLTPAFFADIYQAGQGNR